MAQELLLHDLTKQALERLRTGKTHAALITAKRGAGKRTLVRALAADILNTMVEKLPNTAGYLEIVPDGKSILIEQVRELQHFLSLKTTGTATIRRVVAILMADTMTTDAQNALLKTLEEPPADTLIILTAEQMESILPTIRSRAQIVHLASPVRADVVAHFVALGHKQDVVERAYGLSGGLVGAMQQLLTSSDSTFVTDIERAKQLLAKTTFERLAMVDELSKQKDDVAGLLVALKRICQGALEQAASRDATSAVRAWHARLALVAVAEERFHKSANPKLLLTDLFLHI